MKRDALIQKRLAKGLSQAELSRKVGLSMITVCNVENGRMVRPSNIPKLADAYGFTPQEFVLILFEGLGNSK